VWVRPNAKPKAPSDDTGRKAVASAAKAGVRWLVRAVLVAADITAPEIVAALEISELLARPHFLTFRPISIRRNRSPISTRRRTTLKQDNDIHHIVEQATAAADGARTMPMRSPDNLVRIPTLKHWS